VGGGSEEADGPSESMALTDKQDRLEDWTVDSEPHRMGWDGMGWDGTERAAGNADGSW